MDQKKSPNRRSKRQTKVTEESFWDCSVCTYRNTAEAFKCLMCDVRKGTSTRKPRINPQLVAQQVAQQYNQVTPKVKRDGLPLLSSGSKTDPSSPGGSTVGGGSSMDAADVTIGDAAELSGCDDAKSGRKSADEGATSLSMSIGHLDSKKLSTPVTTGDVVTSSETAGGGGGGAANTGSSFGLAGIVSKGGASVGVAGKGGTPVGVVGKVAPPTQSVGKSEAMPSGAVGKSSGAVSGAVVKGATSTGSVGKGGTVSGLPGKGGAAVAPPAVGKAGSVSGSGGKSSSVTGGVGKSGSTGGSVGKSGSNSGSVGKSGSAASGVGKTGSLAGKSGSVSGGVGKSGSGGSSGVGKSGAAATAGVVGKGGSGLAGAVGKSGSLADVFAKSEAVVSDVAKSGTASLAAGDVVTVGGKRGHEQRDHRKSPTVPVIASGGSRAAAVVASSKSESGKGGAPAGVGRAPPGELFRGAELSKGTSGVGGGGGGGGGGSVGANRGGAGVAVALGFPGVPPSLAAGNGMAGLGMAACDFPTVPAGMEIGMLRGVGGVAGVGAADAMVSVGGGSGMVAGGGLARPTPLNNFPPPTSLRAEKKNNNAMHSDGKPSRKARRLTYPSRPKLKNIDRSSAQHKAVTVNNVTVIITEFQPKRHQSSSAASSENHHHHHLNHGHQSSGVATAAAAAAAAVMGGAAHGPPHGANSHRNGVAAGVAQQQQNGNHSDSTNLSNDSHSDGRSS